MKIAVVGAGFTGATIANLLHPHHDVTVFEARPVLGGMAYTYRNGGGGGGEYGTGVMVHARGPHIFHTKWNHVRDYVQKFGEWKPFDLRVKSTFQDRVYSGPPINLHTANQFLDMNWSPAEFRGFCSPPRGDGKTFAEKGEYIFGALYFAFLENYTRKQWGREPNALPASLFDRIPIRFDYDDRKYPREEWQAIPVEGYTEIIHAMLADVRVRSSYPFQMSFCPKFDHIFWTGPLDAYFDYSEGRLPYRTLDFQHEYHEGDYQGCPVMNFPGDEPWTRITEHKHFAPWEKHDQTVITKEIPRECGPGDTPFYPIDLADSQPMVEAYRKLAAEERNVTFCGRLGTYHYIDMDRAIYEAIECVRKFQSL